MALPKLSAGAAALLMIASLPVGAEDAPVEAQIVDAMNKLFGVHAGFRANHAKGIVAVGRFKPSPEASTLSKAVLFDGPSVPVTVRFSDATGLPTIPDGSGGANPHGLAIKFHLPDGNETDMVINSLKFFPVATGAEFRDLLLALAESPPDAPKPTKFETFAKSHPQVARAQATVATPDSFADEQYNGVDAFILVNKKGAKQAVRYIAVPEKLVHLDQAEAAKMPPDFLVDELTARLAKGPVTFYLKAQLASPSDQTKDPSLPWPDENKVVELGVLTIDKAAPDSLEAQKQLLFLPGRLVDGIELSDDPLISVRDGAYAVSFSRRNP
ncbi:catalase family peroxidase [Methylocapsa acidiphila]|uniref:catalase family peroxidase n=1 Tax=Methylocapsa acidiphila TaxID=133552 RepID=UPI00040A2D2E|nr:catalase family peroxidase [Methylocapsa acidiphila]